MKLNLPNDVEYIINKLNSEEFDGYVVGGCVRDGILGRNPKDWDITTNATPQQVKDIFKDDHVIPTGEKYGTVTILINQLGYEVTTYRNDGKYSDGRRPDEVTFSNSLYEDLSRRDLTINAIAYNHIQGIVDPFNGAKDIEDEVIRCVGDPIERLNEDALRIMRCVRFAGRYGFTIDDSTLAAMGKLINTLTNVSNERIGKELKEIICNFTMKDIECVTLLLLQIIPELKQCVEFEQHNPYHYLNVYDHIMHSVSQCNPLAPFEVKMALLLHDIGKPRTYSVDDDGIGHFYEHAEASTDMAYDILKRLKFSNKEIETITSLVKYHDRTISSTKRSIKKALNVMGKDVFEMLLDVKRADMLAQSKKFYDGRNKELLKVLSLYQSIVEDNDCFKISDLAINGADIISCLGIEQGKDIGVLLNEALSFVVENSDKNNKDDILSYLKALTK